ncbi:hypothetical protein FOMPIDRAFT_1058416 [Fomitopsis schrenkii]|uniref:tRNA(Ile)-lysidine synthetase n=1 Tax=Fomitopsis schrenkii TaxID=2126942 RepID=S8ELB5_FOMSC|nr:hypothetical protein FOMPIDRAFT_1058416 [Fomitopsis schrenkii]
MYASRRVASNDWAAVANSGGPDSTCLLWHLSSLIKKDGPTGLPRRVVSLHINHKLQKASDDMAALAEQSARALGVEHRVFTVPWSRPPYPAFPESASTELHARRARMRALFDQMSEEGAAAIAFGHHADDQVETVMMRYISGSRVLGLRGMLPVRRWGMGNSEGDGALDFYGETGMSRWVVRPFLSVPKARLLSTCERHGLEYAVDKTNFNPSLTSRNAIRHMLGTYTKLISESPISVGMDTAQLASGLDEPRSVDSLREIVRQLGQRVDIINGQVSSLLTRVLLPTLPSTVTLSSPWLKGIPAYTLEGLVSRVLRYVSSHPWGSTRAQAKGSRSTYTNTVAKLTEVVLPRRTFASGAAVMFIPGAVVREGAFRQSEPSEVNRRAWRAQKAPPYARDRLHTDKISDSLVVDLTPRLLEWREGEPYPTVLYDNRFLVEFVMSQVPQTVLATLKRGPGAHLTEFLSYWRSES